MTVYTALSSDETPSVRKHAAITLSLMIKLIPHTGDSELLNIFARFFRDEQDSVKMYCIDSCVEFSQKLTPQKVTGYILPYVRSLANDRSWRIRYQVADRMVDLAVALG